MRVGFIGLSTPVAFDYRVEATRTDADLSSSPNPILDSPFGLMLLYDELWFLTRSLCPENMRGCSFVRFLDEEGMLPDLAEINVDARYRAFLDEEAHGPQRGSGTSVSWAKVEEIPKSWDAGWDNHSHGLKIGEKRMAANAGDPRLILFDLAVVEALDNRGVELTGNVIGQRRMEILHPAVRSLDLAHVLTVEHVPNYLSPEGPYHPVIDEVREDRFLKDFRRWITETAQTSTEEAAVVKAEVEQGLREAQREAFLNYLDPKSHYSSVAKTVTGAIADLVVPGVGTTAQLIQDVRVARSARDERWQGFLVGIEAAAERAERGGPT